MTLANFFTIAAATPYRPKGVWYSEMFLFLNACLNHRVSLIIETGVRHGMSTSLLSATRAYWRVISIDRSFQIEAPDGVEFVRGDAEALVPTLVLAEADERIGVLIDGPKNEAARALKDRCLEFPAVRVVAIHGTLRDQGEAMHSHDPRCDVYRSVDRFVDAEARAIYPKGPGLSVWVAA